jgi:bla regulator protein BlaR1
LRKLFKFNIISEVKSFKIIEIPSSNVACTFNRTIFLGEDLTKIEREQIIEHELIHVQQKHSYDLVYFEILKTIFWFNPLIYIYQNRIAALHEFIADSNVVRTTEKRCYYEQLLNSAFNTQNISFINQFFNHSLIKKRILMLQKSQSKTISKFKYLIILPLSLLMLTYVSCSEKENSEIIMTNSVEIENDIITLKVKDLKNLTEQEKEKMEMYISEIASGSNYKALKMIDGEKSITIGSSGNMKVERRNGKSEILANNVDVPFALIEQVPLFPGCESLSSNEEQKKCMSQKIQGHVQENFNIKLGEEVGLKGVNRVIVQFKIDKNGNIVDVRSRAPHQKLEEEASRVINSLPKMIPGKQKGKNVGVMYSLPIVFQVD